MADEQKTDKVNEALNSEKPHWAETKYMAAKTERDELRAEMAKLKSAEDKRTQASEEAKGNYDSLKSGFEKTDADQKAEIADLKKYKTKFDALQTATREAQIAELPESQREFAGTLNDEQLAAFTKTNKHKPLKTADDSPIGTDGKPFTDSGISEGIKKEGKSFGLKIFGG